MCEPMVERSTKRLARLPSIPPPAPVATSSEACSDGRLASTVSARSATSFGEEAACAPSATNLSTASLRWSNTTSRCLASIRRRAMGKPIFPGPMNPMSMVCASASVDFGEHFARDAEAVDARGHAGIDRHLHEDFANLVLGHAVDQRALDVHPQFMGPVEYRNHGKIEHAAGLARQFLAAPHPAPPVFGNQFLKRLVEIVGVLEGVGDICLAQHRLSNFQPLVVRFLVHGVSLGFSDGSTADVTRSPLSSHAFVSCVFPGGGYLSGTDVSLPPLC